MNAALMLKIKKIIYNLNKVKQFICIFKVRMKKCKNCYILYFFHNDVYILFLIRNVFKHH